MSNKLFFGLIGFLVIGVFLTATFMNGNRPEKKVHTNSQGEIYKLVTYKSPTCGCCENWVAYMRSKGYEVDVVDTDDMERIKQQYNVSENLYSCHTTIVDGGEYYVEGHIPEESVAKLLREAPEIQGIGMPGMPSGSPGMPGAKDTQFEIMQVDKNENMSTFEVI